MVDFNREPIRPDLWEGAPETLYHYCSAATFQLIVSNRKVRLSDLTQSNDRAEGEWYWAVLKTLFEGEQVPAWIDSTRAHHASLNNVTLGLCLSEQGDLLSQWRGYADDARGFCIGFNPSAFVAGTPNGPGLYKAIYSSEEQFRIVEWVRQMQSQRGPTDNILENSSFFQFVFKNGGFREEEEWRLISVEPLSSCEYGARGNRIVPYRDLEFGAQAISSVRIGPRNSTPRNVIEAMLRRYGFDNADVHSAVATYR